VEVSRSRFISSVPRGVDGRRRDLSFSLAMSSPNTSAVRRAEIKSSNSPAATTCRTFYHSVSTTINCHSVASADGNARNTVPKLPLKTANGAPIDEIPTVYILVPASRLLTGPFLPRNLLFVFSSFHDVSCVT